LPDWHRSEIKNAAEHEFPCASARACYLGRVTFWKRRSARQRTAMLFHFLSIAMLAGLVGLVTYELVAEVRGAGDGLHDRYHE